MKKILLAGLIFASTISVAQAESLSLLKTGNATISGDINDVTGQAIGTKISQGILFANDPFQLVQFTYLGAEAADNNIMTQLRLGPDTQLFNNQSSAVGDTAYIRSGLFGDLWFGFKDLTTGSQTFVNGSSSIGYLLFGEAAAAFGGYEYIIGFNDNGSSDGDFDDLVVGVKGVSAVPVPAALPLLASALGMFGVARRRKTLV
ncbi:MAG: PEP-CTERM sorting domain-containing protein [Methylophilus sp.]|nr:PEP-CTERM sorting domain-containing protein [Methylophilus sp.]MDP3608858.1 PEP-CTERM sorting domain-containing protein [Methylophilus sp.]